MPPRSSPALHPTILLALAVALGGASLLAQSDKETDSKRPRITLRAQPSIAVAPARVVLTAEVVGGPDDFEEFYCPAIEWQWGDGTSSESSADCEPYEPGKSTIKRRYTIQHVFRNGGAARVYFHLKRKDRILASASTTIQVQPGMRPY